MVKRTRDKSSRIKPRVIGFPLAILLIGLLYSLAAATPVYAATRSEYAGCPELHMHPTGQCVQLVQAQLDEDQVKPHLQIDGIYLDQTRRAVNNFQRAVGIPVDGIVGSQTYNALIHYESGAGIPTPGTSGFGHFTRSAWGTICSHATPYVIVPAAAGVIMLIALGMVLRHARRPDVKSLHLEWGRRGIKVYADSHTPQRIIQSQSDTLKHIYASRSPNELPAPDNAIRSIEGGNCRPGENLVRSERSLYPWNSYSSSAGELAYKRPEVYVS